MTCGLCQKWLIWLQGGNIICATFWGDCAVTQTSLSSSWCMSNHFLSVFNLITCKIQTWFPEFIHSVWSAAQMLRVTCDLCFWIQSGVLLLLLFCFLFVCNVWGEQSKLHNILNGVWGSKSITGDGQGFETNSYIEFLKKTQKDKIILITWALTMYRIGW